MPPFFIEGVLLSSYAYDIKAQRQKRKFNKFMVPQLKLTLLLSSSLIMSKIRCCLSELFCQPDWIIRQHPKKVRPFSFVYVFNCRLMNPVISKKYKSIQTPKLRDYVPDWSCYGEVASLSRIPPKPPRPPILRPHPRQPPEDPQSGCLSFKFRFNPTPN